MVLNVESSEDVAASRIGHQVFHADEERELDAMFAELSHSDVHVPGWEGPEWAVPMGRERQAIAFGTFGSI
ncbi:hypothetical protein VVD49_03470 [Uliginosibacterium sp. H3]|uniref:Uncharacterized protein n=1 Tax=Uliginosibacterium silvisoli TaxID=3114758 RepID=A0ABU6JZJ7_9RHOO|nr:hypothetical protein [Uliginosibacterium sp. H3]